MNNSPGSAPNFTKACIVMFGVNIVWILIALWAFWGLIAAAATGWGINRLFTWIEGRRD
ncbi:MAG: hypothetical protein ABJP06_04590 [Sulfitobacter sp.]